MNPVVGKTYMLTSLGGQHIERIVVVLDKSDGYSVDPYCKLLRIYSFLSFDQNLHVYKDYMVDERHRKWEIL